MNIKTIYIQFTAGKGPVECALACEAVVKYFFDTYIDEYHFKIVECEDDDYAGYRSIILELPNISESDIQKLKSKWEGTIKFISTKNSVRPNHKRKNWFIGVNFFEAPDTIETNIINPKDLKWETMRANGPGGQNVNKVSSAVRVTHIPTGITVKCDSSRDQIRNRETAVKILLAKLNALNNIKQEEHKNLIWMNHNTLERGNEIMTIRGEI